MADVASLFSARKKNRKAKKSSGKDADAPASGMTKLKSKKSVPTKVNDEYFESDDEDASAKIADLTAPTELAGRVVVDLNTKKKQLEEEQKAEEDSKKEFTWSAPVSINEKKNAGDSATAQTEEPRKAGVYRPPGALRVNQAPAPTAELFPTLGEANEIIKQNPSAATAAVTSSEPTAPFQPRMMPTRPPPGPGDSFKASGPPRFINSRKAEPNPTTFPAPTTGPAERPRFFNSGEKPAPNPTTAEPIKKKLEELPVKAEESQREKQEKEVLKVADKFAKLKALRKAKKAATASGN